MVGADWQRFKGRPVMFRALVMEKEGDAAVAHLRELEDAALPVGDCQVADAVTIEISCRDRIGCITD